ncbi:PAS domain-containing protein [Ideonella sp. BN130291]|uniref:PAS domain-containing protein n=1 Tax=Ideonella sp. BN130291 TaxID=3112940 RepID=UPI002E2551C6|nr:PAS domain-containing protein [Ideonella sp. BN130291]
MTLSRRLLLLMLAVLLPTAALFAWIVVATYQRELDSERQHLRETVHALALVVDRELDKRSAVARTLAITSGIQEGDHRRFYDEAQAATQGTGDWVVLVDDQNQLVDTSVPFGSGLPARADGSGSPRTEGATGVSSLRLDPATRTRVITVFAPVPRVVPAHFQVGVVFTPAALQAILTEQRLPAGWVAAIVDREYTVVGRTPDPQAWVGKPSQPDLVAAVQERPEGFIESMALDGIPVRAFFSRSPAHGWTVIIGVPQARLTAAARRAAWTAGIAAAALAAFASGLAIWSAGRIRRPIEALERAAQELARDRTPALEPTGLVEADAVGAALHRAGVQAAQINDMLERRVAAALAQARQAQARSEELQRVLAEELLQLIADNLPVLISYVDREMRYRLNNRAYETWFGQPREQITGRLVQDVCGPANWEQLQPRMQAALAGKAQLFEVQLHYPGVGPRWVEISYIPHRAPTGAVEGVAILVHDVSARRAAHEALRRDEEAQRLLLALQDAGRGQRDPLQLQSDIVSLVGRHFAVSRCTYGEVDPSEETLHIARDHSDGVAPLPASHRLADLAAGLLADMKAGRTVAIADLAQDPRTSGPVQRQAFEALQARAMLCVPLVKEGRLVAALMLLHQAVRPWEPADIALVEQVAERTWFAVEAARAEAQLLESRNVLSLAMRGGRMGAWSRDLLTERVWWSRELEEIFGLPPGGFHGTTSTFRSMVHPDDRPAMEAAIGAALQNREDYAVEFRFRHADGQWRWMEGRGRAVYGPDGRPTMLYGLGIDITARKGTEEELRRLNAELAEADRRKDEFLATLAHELRNPLAPITNALEVLRLKNPVDPAVRWTRDVIDRQVRQMTRLVDDLLDVARITRGRIELRIERVDAAAIVQGAVEAARPFIDASGHTLEVQLPHDTLWLDADPTRLTQVLLNLLNNAAKYTPRGGHIRVSAGCEDAQAVLRVRDTGIGLAPEHLPTVFEMFSQVAPALERSQGGLGIGLALARGLVELHRGSIEAHSAGAGQGSEFVVRLPLPAGAAEPGASIAPGPGGQAPVLRVLVVDDNRDAAESLAMILELTGHEVALAHDGPTALDLALRFLPDLVLLDIGMPGMNGYEVARRLRAQPHGQRMVLAALTGWGQREDKQRAIQAGFDHHLTKPADGARLDAVLSSASAAMASRAVQQG